MPTTTSPDTLSRDEQAALWHLARGGDESAKDALVRANLPFLCRKAHSYARKFGADPDDLLSEALAAFPYAFRSFDPAHGSFLNYYATAACRAMARAGRLVESERDAAGPESRSPDLAPAPDEPESPDGESDRRVRHALGLLHPTGRVVLQMAEGYGGRPVPIPRVARHLGITLARARELHREAFNRLSDLLALS